MTKRSRGVLKTRCKAIVSSTTPRFGPRWPPVWERTLINSSRTSCASCGRSCSSSALMSAGERIPSSKRVGAIVVSAVRAVSEEFDFVICILGVIGNGRLPGRLRCCLKVLNYRLTSAIASNDFDLLFGVSKSFLANFHQIHAFLVTHDQIFERQFARLHLFHNFFEPIQRAFEVKLYFTRLRFAAHGANEELSTAWPGEKGRLPGVRSASQLKKRADSAEIKQSLTFALSG